MDENQSKALDVMLGSGDEDLERAKEQIFDALNAEPANNYEDLHKQWEHMRGVLLGTTKAWVVLARRMQYLIGVIDKLGKITEAMQTVAQAPVLAPGKEGGDEHNANG